MANWALWTLWISLSLASMSAQAAKKRECPQDAGDGPVFQCRFLNTPQKLSQIDYRTRYLSEGTFCVSHMKKSGRFVFRSVLLVDGFHQNKLVSSDSVVDQGELTSRRNDPNELDLHKNAPAFGDGTDSSSYYFSLPKNSRQAALKIARWGAFGAKTEDVFLLSCERVPAKASR